MIDCTHIYSQIFGDILVKAEYEEDGNPCCPESNGSFDQGVLEMTFTNGKRVKFWNSEWGGLNAYEEESK